MKLLFFVLVLLAVPVRGDSPAATSEALTYNLFLPNGLSLGELRWTARRGPEGSTATVAVEYAFPGYAVRDSASARANAQGCALELRKATRHGQRRSEEVTTFDPAARTATRQTIDGGQSTFPTGSCARDALTFLLHLRQELTQGRLPAPLSLFYGAKYDTKVTFGARETLIVDGESQPVDRLLVSVKGPSAQLTGDLLLARDPARTPVRARVTIGNQTFVAEVVRE